MFNELFVQRSFPSPASMKNFVSSAVAPATAKFTPEWMFWSLVSAKQGGKYGNSYASAS